MQEEEIEILKNADFKAFSSIISDKSTRQNINDASCKLQHRILNNAVIIYNHQHAAHTLFGAAREMAVPLTGPLRP